MGRCGKRGISETLITGRIFSGRIPTGADTGKVSVMTRVSMKRIIAARGLGGRKDTVAPPLKNNPSQGDQDQVPPRWLRLRDPNRLLLASPRLREQGLLLLM